MRQIVDACAERSAIVFPAQHEATRESLEASERIDYQTKQVARRNRRRRIINTRKTPDRFHVNHCEQEVKFI